jgi:hypothetical protein
MKGSQGPVVRGLVVSSPVVRSPVVRSPWSIAYVPACRLTFS